MNKIKIVQRGNTDKQINIPLKLEWDFNGQEELISSYEAEVTSKVIGRGFDFEVDRFPHEVDSTGSTKIHYEFYFHTGSSLTQASSWITSYLPLGFTKEEIFYKKNNFSKSFFKLDFYDTVDMKKQTNYITLIIPTTQGDKTKVFFNQYLIDINTPKFGLDFVGDVEGFFIYWLKNLDFININTFYMSAKFFNAKTGQFIKMVNIPQSLLTGSRYNFDIIRNFYYRVVLNYENRTYQIFDTQPISTSQRYGISTNPIVWYEYVNPPQ